MSRAACPSCGALGRGVGDITVLSLVREEARTKLGAVTAFSFCASQGCEVAYFSVDGRTVAKSDVTVRIGVKETESPRPLCYCFDYTAEQIEAEAKTGATSIIDEITAKCREGLDRCPETNPRGACCLGDVRRAAKSANSVHDEPAPACCASAEPEGDSAEPAHAPKVSALAEADPMEREAGAGGWAFGASMATAVGAAFAAAACCVGPLVVALLGVGGAGAMVALAPYRPYLLGLTVGLLALGFYWVYRRRPVDECDCETPDARRKRHLAAGTLWVTTALVALFAASPYLINAADASTQDGSALVSTASTHTVVIPVQGMDCPSCAVPIRQALDSVGGVRAFDMDLDAHTITVTFEGGSDASARYATAVGELGYGVGEPREVR